MLHRVPTVANIIVTPQYLQFTQQVMSSHDKANRQAEMDVSPAMGDMLTEMQGCLKQLCGNSAVGNPEAVAQLIAEKMAAMNISPGQTRVQDSCDDDLLALPAPVQIAAPETQVHLAQEALDFSNGLIQAPILYDTSASAPSHLHGQSGTMGPLPLQRGLSRSKLTPLWC